MKTYLYFILPSILLLFGCEEKELTFEEHFSKTIDQKILGASLQDFEDALGSPQESSGPYVWYQLNEKERVQLWLLPKPNREHENTSEAKRVEFITKSVGIEGPHEILWPPKSIKKSLTKAFSDYQYRYERLIND